MKTIIRAVHDPEMFSRTWLPARALRPYQMDAARPVIASVLDGHPDQFAIVFARQAGKDETLAQLLAFLLFRRRSIGGTVIVAAPTYKPQALVSRDRLLAVLRANPLTMLMVRTPDAATVQVGDARVRFLSAARTANARGQTADLLLVANEAQDINPDVWDAVFDPMAASTNATTLFLGTVWSRNTLLARQMRYLRGLESADGQPRVFLVPWQRVARDVPAYGDRVRARIDHLGESHPFIRTEYFLEELDGENSLFPPARIAQLQGDHPRCQRAEPGKRYALLLDVAGEEESGGSQAAFAHGTSRRDSSALTIVHVDTAARSDGRPVYRVVDRRVWTGANQAELHDQLVDLARSAWKASWLVIDATGIGAGMASFLEANLRPGGVRVVPFTFTGASKSRLGWDLIGLIDSGRLKEYADDGATETGLLHAQLRATTYEVLPGPGNVLRWSVPEADGHDDLIMSLALAAALDTHDLRPRIAMGS